MPETIQQELSDLQLNDPLGISELDILVGRTVVPVPLRNKPQKKNRLFFEYTEHSYIGDAINLTLADGQKVPAHDYKFILKNGLAVTYGQINGLAGDFYGTDKPISDGADAEDQSRRFVEAYNTLAGVSHRQPKEAQNILTVLNAEVNAVNDALHRQEDPSTVYDKLPSIVINANLQRYTLLRPPHFPSYLGLALINWDHFGQDARTAYNAGHGKALQVAADGDLEYAYTLNAFADHFLEDSFSAGHLRTPRRGLHKPTFLKLSSIDYCAKLMHDEDSAIGLSVNNLRGDSWTCYGDKRALDNSNKKNLEYCVEAIQASADEIYTAYKTRTTPNASSYSAWNIAPTLESALHTPQVLAPLFKYNEKTHGVDRRDLIMNRLVHNFTSDWSPYSTARDCLKSGWWKYPITIDGPRKFIPWTSFAAITPHTGATCLYYQSPSGGVLESRHDDGQWTGGVNQETLWDAAPFTPLAAINWDSGNQIRVYYLSVEYQLREYCCHNGSWSPGELDGMDIQAAHDTSIAALKYGSNGQHIRVYCQEEGSNEIKEFCRDDDGKWFRGATLPLALSGTSIAAISYEAPSQGLQIRVYYQAEDLSIREHCFSGKDWFPGEFNGVLAPGRTQIGALARGRGVMDVYWVNPDSELTHRVNVNGTWPETSEVLAPLRRGTKFALAQWEDGKHIRVYYQSADSSVLEISKDDTGDWCSGVAVSDA